jgi:hypothetical protein
MLGSVSVVMLGSVSGAVVNIQPYDYYTKITGSIPIADTNTEYMK